MLIASVSASITIQIQHLDISHKWVDYQINTGLLIQNYIKDGKREKSSPTVNFSAFL